MNMKPCTVLAVGALVFASVGFAQEKKVTRSELPSSVQKTVAEQSKGAKIRGFSREKEHGQTYYEAEMLVNGHSKDVLMNNSGKVVEVEEQVALDKLPAEIKSGLEAQAGKGKVTKVESLTKDDKLVAYEAVVVANGKHHEIQVGPDGKPLTHEE